MLELPAGVTAECGILISCYNGECKLSGLTMKLVYVAEKHIVYQMMYVSRVSCVT